MPRINVRLSEAQAEAARKHGDGDGSRGVRRLIADHLGVGEAEATAPFFTDAIAAKKASKKGAKARWGGAKK